MEYMTIWTQGDKDKKRTLINLENDFFALSEKVRKQFNSNLNVFKLGTKIVTQEGGGMAIIVTADFYDNKASEAISTSMKVEDTVLIGKTELNLPEFIYLALVKQHEEKLKNE